MWLLGVATFWLVVVTVRGNQSDFSALIRRIHWETNTGTIYFVGVHDTQEYLSEIVASSVLVPVEILTEPSKSSALIEEFVVLVVRTSCLELSEWIIRRIKHRKFVIVVGEDLEALEENFVFLAERKFTRIYGVAGGVSFAYLPYADNPVRRLEADGPLPDGLSDLNGFSVRSTVLYDIPRVFWHRNPQGEWVVGGSVGQLFLCFLRRHNATLTEVLINNSRTLFIPGVLNATINGIIDISMNTYNPMEGVDLSYPLSLMQWTIMVPLNGHVDPHQYFLRPFTATVWFFIAFTVVYIVVLDVVKDYYADEPIDLWRYFSRTVLTLLFMSTKPITKGYRFQAQVHLLAFILTNLYTVYLTSFLTVFINVKQYDTIQDLIDNDVRVMMTDYEWVEISDPDQHKPGFENIITLVDGPVYTRERNSMRNTSFAYAVGMDKAQFLLRLQATFDKPRFRTIYDSLQDFYLGFLMAKHCIFQEILNNFIIEVMGTGLVEKWTRDAVVQASKAGLIEVTYIPRKGQAPLTLDHLLAAWTCLVVGLTVASVVFVIEMGFGFVQRFCCGLRRT